MITIGIDPHKSSHTTVALDPTGRIVGELRVPDTRTTLERLLRWAERWPDQISAVEAAAGQAVERGGRVNAARATTGAGVVLGRQLPEYPFKVSVPPCRSQALWPQEPHRPTLTAEPPPRQER